MNNQISTTSSEVSQKELNQIILYRPNDTISLEVRLENETVWLTQMQIAELFDVNRTSIVKHIKNIYTTKELEENSTCAIFSQVRLEGNRKIIRDIPFYNLDMIISVGYRVNSIRGTQFRQWANKILKDYLLKGHAINSRITFLEQKVAEHSEKIDFFVRTSLPPSEGVFHNGQIFDAYKFACIIQMLYFCN